MNKRIKILISAILIVAVCVSAFVVPAASYTNDIETTTADMLLINLDTDTIVYSQKPDNMWYAGYLAELTTFIVAYNNISNPSEVKYKVEQSFIDALPYSDGCLDAFVGQTITAYDLMAIMLMTSGSDAAYALADLSTDGDRTEFVNQMNSTAKSLGCTKTGYVSPGFNNTNDQYTTCRDLSYIYKELLNIDLYTELASNETYTPSGLTEKEEGEFTVNTQASILNSNSPYYFRYATTAKFSYSEDTDAALAVTTTYRNINYLFVGLLGLNEAESNVYSDGRRLISWAYVNLSDQKVIDSDDVISQLTMSTDWGEYQVPLYTFNSDFKTLPNVYDTAKLNFDVDIPDSVKTPLFAGEVVGTAKLYYDDIEIDSVELMTDTDQGLDLLLDSAKFGSYALSKLMPIEPVEEEEEETSETTSTASNSSSDDDIGGI